jgi:hypothetical protein
MVTKTLGMSGDIETAPGSVNDSAGALTGLA